MEDFDPGALDADSRSFLEDAIQDYNDMFKTNFDTSSERFQNYYKDLSLRLKNRQIDLVIVVNMFLTGFDATTLNTLWVDKNLRSHGLIQAFSRTNRILNSVKTFGNIVSFRDLEEETNDAIALLFGNKDAKGIVLLKPYADYYDEYEQRIAERIQKYPLGTPIVGESHQKEFIGLFGSTGRDDRGRTLVRCVSTYSTIFHSMRVEAGLAKRVESVDEHLNADKESLVNARLAEVGRGNRRQSKNRVLIVRSRVRSTESAEALPTDLRPESRGRRFKSCHPDWKVPGT